MFCQRCGKSLTDGSVLCDGCGTRQKGRNVRRKATRRKSNTGVMVIVGACVAVIGFVAGMAVVSNKDKHKTAMTGAEVQITDNENDVEAVVPDTSKKQTEKKEIKTTHNETENADVLSFMSDDEKREVNIFLSNFSEAGFEFYDPVEYVKDADLISFAFRHNSINSHKKTVYRNGDMGISAENVDITLKRFFGRTVPHSSTGSIDSQKWTYSNGMFFTPAADGDSCSYFTIATEMTNNGNGTYTVKFNVYFDEERVHDEQFQEWYTYTVSQANSRCILKCNGEAIVKPKKHNGSDTYELVSYFTYKE